MDGYWSRKAEITHARQLSRDLKQTNKRAANTYTLIKKKFLNTLFFRDTKTKMARPQFTMEQRNFLVFEYNKRKGTRNFKDEILTQFEAKFPGVRRPGTNQMAYVWRKQMEKGTVNNCNSKSSPGDTYSGRTRTVRTPALLVKGVMDRDAVKVN